MSDYNTAALAAHEHAQSRATSNLETYRVRAHAELAEREMKAPNNVLDTFADDIWDAMGKRNEARFIAAVKEDDPLEVGEVVMEALWKIAHDLTEDRADEAAQEIARDAAEAAMEDR